MGELVASDVLEQETARSGFERVVDVLVEVEGGEYQDACGRHLDRELPGGLDPVQSRHPDIHQHDIRVQLPRAVDGFDPVGGLADDLMSASASRIIRKPTRTSSWSSTISTRMVIARPAQRERKGRAHPPPGAVGPNLERPAEHAHSLTHGGETVSGVWLGRDR